MGWALLHLCLALPLNALLPKGGERIAAPSATPEADDPPPPRLALWVLAFVFAATWFNSTAMAAHLPGLLQAAGATPAVAIAAGALIGPAQVAARVLEFGEQVMPRKDFMNARLNAFMITTRVADALLKARD